MADNDVLAAAFEEHRDHLRAVAYRLLGSVSDAEDAVQDTWLRLTGANASEVENLGGWLTTVVARVSLNMLRSRRHRQEEPVGDSWPVAAEVIARTEAAAGADAAVTASQVADPEDEAVLADSVGLALLVVLDTLTPAERLAFVLHDLFAMPFTEVADVLGRTPDAARQLASRARRRVRGGELSADHAADLGRQRKAATAFLAAARGGDPAALLGLLDADVVLEGDSFVMASHRPTTLRGAEIVAKGASLASARAEQSQLAVIDGSVGVVWAPAGKLQLVLTFEVSPAGLITHIGVIADPARLRRLNLALLPGQLPG
ncbi:MAG TPA: sigma-70 family RNA polymerase sigma factor [Streptosporangiaceae bacterium]